jgi:hypothetical protein
MRLSLPSKSMLLPSDRTVAKTRLYLTLVLAGLAAVAGCTAFISGVVILILSALAVSVSGIIISALTISSGLATLFGLYIWITAPSTMDGP